MPTVIGLPWTDDGDVFDYGGGSLMMYLSAEPPTDSDYDVLACTAYRIPPGTPSPPSGNGERIAELPARVIYAAAPTECGKTVCPTIPPRPGGATVPPTEMRLRVRKAGVGGVSISPTEMRIESPTMLGPVYQLTSDASFGSLIAELEARVGTAQSPARIFHLYRVVDPRPILPKHAFHGKVLAIPVDDPSLPPQT